MSIKVTPSQWMNIFPGAKDRADYFENNFIRINAHESFYVNYFATSTVDAYKISPNILDTYYFYYPKNSIREEINHNYGDGEGTALELIRKGTGFLSEIGKTITVGAGVLKGGQNNIGVLVETPTYFLHTDKRRFDIILDLYDTGNIEQDVYNPILFFKKYSHARLGERFADTYNMVFPSTFTIYGGIFSNTAVAQITQERRHLVLKNMTVEYNSELQGVNKDGFPVHAHLTLSFEELKSNFSQHWSDAKDAEKIYIREKGTK